MHPIASLKGGNFPCPIKRQAKTGHKKKKKGGKKRKGEGVGVAKRERDTDREREGNFGATLTKPQSIKRTLLDPETLIRDTPF